MMAGVVAATGMPAPGAGAVAGEGMLNFITGTYDFDSVSYTAAQVVDHDEYITANGLEIPASTVNGSAQIILSPFAAKLGTCHWTMVLEVNLLSVIGGSANFIYTQTDTSETYWIEAVEWNDWFADCSDGINNPIAEDLVNAFSTGIHKFAVTRINNKISISVDGNAVVSDTTACTLPVPGFPMTKFYFGGYSSSTDEGFYLRSCAIKDPVADAVLPGLSGYYKQVAIASAKNISVSRGPTLVNASSIQTATGINMTLNLPASIVAGNMLIALTSIASSRVPVWPAGWNAIGAGFAAWRSADGTESSGPNVSWTGSSTQSGYILQYAGTTTTLGNTSDNQAQTGTSATTTAVTTTAAASTCIAFVLSGTTTIPTLPSGFSPQTSLSGALSYLTGRIFVASNGGTSPSVTSTVANSTWRVALVEMKHST